MICCRQAPDATCPTKERTTVIPKQNKDEGHTPEVVALAVEQELKLELVLELVLVVSCLRSLPLPLTTPITKIARLCGSRFLFKGSTCQERATVMLNDIVCIKPGVLPRQEEVKVRGPIDVEQALSRSKLGRGDERDR